MKALTVPSCCCFDLRTGGLIIGYLDVIFTGFWLLFNLTNIGWWNFFFKMLVVMVYVSWIYGIYEEKTSFMLPNVILCMVLLMFSILLMIIIPIIALCFEFGIIAAAEKNRNGPNADDSQTVLNMLSAMIYFVWLIFAIATAIQWYFTSVIYSLYQGMKRAKNGQRSSPNIQI